MTATADRMSDGYVPDWDIDSEFGTQGQLFVADILNMLQKGNARLEIKRDAKAAKYGNVYIERQCLRAGAFVPSGIDATKAELWAVLLPNDVIVIASTEKVRQLADRFPLRDGGQKGDHPTKGACIPLGYFVQELAIPNRRNYRSVKTA